MAVLSPDSALIKAIRERFDQGSDYWERQFSLSMDDLRFCSHENQWPADVRQMRSGRPCYTADRLNAQVKQLTNAQRENRPACTCHAINDLACPDTAEVIQGMFRHQDNRSNTSQAVDTAGDWQVRVGLGFWRLVPRYIKSGSFDQEIRIERISNPFNVLIDPSYRMADGGDMGWAFIMNWMDREEFKVTYPGSDLSQMNDAQWLATGQSDHRWFRKGSKEVLVCEHFWKENVPEELYQLHDQTIVTAAEFEATHGGKSIKPKDYRNHRTQYKTTVHWYKLNGLELLEETTVPMNPDAAYVPLVPVFGDELMEDGRLIYSGIVRRVKEEQMMLNVVKTTAVEMIAALPKQPWLGPQGFMGDRAILWQEANVRNVQALEYEYQTYDNKPLPPPVRQTSEPPIQAIMEFAQSVENDIKATPGMYDPAMGNKMSNDQSGVAIKNLQTQGSVGNYHFSDNLSRAIQLDARIRLSMMPYIYNTKRVEHILGLDNSHKLVTINGTGEIGPDGRPAETGCESPEGVAKVFDLTVGEYDVVVSSGPSYETKRAENLDTMIQMASSDPTFLPQAKDILVGEMDSPVAVQLQERFRKFLPPGIIPPDPDKPGAQLPPEVAQGMQQDHQMIQMLQAKLAEATNILTKTQMELQAKQQISTESNQTKLEVERMRITNEANQLAFTSHLDHISKKMDQNHEFLLGQLKQSSVLANTGKTSPANEPLGTHQTPA